MYYVRLDSLYLLNRKTAGEETLIQASVAQTVDSVREREENQTVDMRLETQVCNTPMYTVRQDKKFLKREQSNL